jgi:hypothetical protein
MAFHTLEERENMFIDAPMMLVVNFLCAEEERKKQECNYEGNCCTLKFDMLACGV